MSIRTPHRSDRTADGARALSASQKVRVPQATTLLRRSGKITAVVTRRAAAACWQIAAARLRHEDTDMVGSFSRQCRLALEDLGPTFVKLGQVLSARSDIAPASLQHELSQLRDHAPSIPQAAVSAELQRSVGHLTTSPFASFEMAPVACASIAQVHRATLHDGRRVAVKIRRPSVCSDIDADLALLRQLLRILASLSAKVRAYDPVGLLGEFAVMLRAETNFAAEADNIEVIRGNLASTDVVTIPSVMTDLSDESLLVMDWIEGVPLSNGEDLDAAGTDRAAIARAIVHAYAAMIFQSDRFHADPHPGNLIALPGARIGLIDFGEVGSVNPAARAALTRMIIAVVGGDSDGLGAAVLSVSRTTKVIDPAGFGAQLATLLRPLADASLKDLMLGKILRELLHLLRARGLVLPPDLAVLIKTMIVCEATTDELDPTFTMLSFLTEFGTLVSPGNGG
jgi:ubiquinone biosynthesis protein